MKRNNESQISLKAFVQLMLRKWYWFVCSLIFFLGVIFVVGKRSVIGNSEYKIGLMTRFVEASNESRTIIKTDKDAPLWRMAPAYAPSQLYGWLVSADIIYRAGLKEGFDVEYTQKHTWGRFDVYNNMPVRLFFLDAKEMDTFSLDLILQGEKAILSNFRGTYRGTKIEQPYECVINRVGESIETPVGRVLMAENPGWNEFEKTPLDLNRKIDIQRLRGIDIRAKYDWDMDLEVEHGTVFLLKIKTSGSPRRSFQLLTAMLEECNETVRKHVLDDLSRERKMLQSSLDSLSSMGSNNLSPEVISEHRRVLENYLAQNIANQEIVQHEHMIEITDPPMIQPAPAGALYVKLSLLLLAFVIPMGGIYILWFYRGVILEKEQLSNFWKEKLPLTIKGKKIGHVQSVLDTLLCLINEDLENAEKSSFKTRLPKRSILLTTPTITPEVSFWVSQIVEIIKTLGQPLRIVELRNPQTKKCVYPGSQIIELNAGYLISDSFIQDLSSTPSENNNEDTISLVFVPSDKVSILQREAASLVVLLICDESKVKDVLSLEEHLGRTDLPTCHPLWIEK